MDPRRPGDRRDGLVTLGLAAVLVALVGIYFIGVDLKPSPDHETGLATQLKASLRVLSVCFGQPVTPYVRPVALVLLGLILAGAAMLVEMWLRQPRERFRASGLLLFLGGTMARLLVFGRSRAWSNWQWQLWGVYMNMAIPALCRILIRVPSYRRPAVGEVMQVTLFTLSCLFFLPNLQRAVNFSQDWRKPQLVIERDIRAGVPASLLAAECRHDDFGFVTEWIEKLGQQILIWKGLAIPQFRAVVEDPVYREIQRSITPTALDGVVWQDDLAYSCCRSPEDASLAFLLDEPLCVCDTPEVRLRG